MFGRGGDEFPHVCGAMSIISIFSISHCLTDVIPCLPAAVLHPDSSNRHHSEAKYLGNTGKQTAVLWRV